MKKKIITIAFIFSLILISSNVYSAEQTLKKVVFMPQWLPQAQFAGYFTAKELGIYKKYGLDVTILNGGPGAPTTAALEEKKADFVTISLPAAIEKKAAGSKIVNIAQIICRSSLMFVTKKKNGILSPKDMNGKKIGYWKNDFIGMPKAFLKKYDINAQFFPINNSVEMFLADGVDAITVMWYNEYHKIINSGINPEELSTFFFYEHDLNFPEDGIYVLEDTFNNDPELCRNFVAASIEGWRHAFENEEETLDIVIKYIKEAHMMANKANQRWMLARMRDIVIPKDANQSIGELIEKDYMKTVNVLLESGSIKISPEYKSFYKSCVKNVSK
ncbi:MAG TPA: ABC transporter substrate-binding protein [Candidatus Wallbacteria bacterium]|nr:ABC transporter substrate-binding protein [Candidatus Wallbacteria bacterium]